MTASAPLLSLCITYHNEKELLTECLKSFQAFSLNSEILIFDDASEFPPGNYIPPGLKVTIVRSEKNLGPGRARNRLWQMAKGTYVHFHDSDDWFLPKWGEQTSAAMVAGVDAFFSEIDSYREGGLFCEKVLGLKEFSGADFLSFCIGKFMLVPSATIRRELIEKIGGFRESLWQSEDFDFYVRLAAQNPTLRFSSDSLVAIRLRRESRSQSLVETMTSALQALVLLRAELPEKYQVDLGEKAALVGSRLYQSGERPLAREAFQFSQSLGAKRYPFQRSLYRWVAQRFGQEGAEWLGLWYRRVLAPLRRT